jgi:adenylate cyclase
MVLFMFTIMDKHMSNTKKIKKPEENTLVVLFADICGSTSLYEALGDFEAQKLVAECLDMLSKIAVKHRGTIIKNIGDEIMCVFPNADLAVEAAKNMHMAMQQQFAITQHGVKKLNIHIGLHLGQVVRKGKDVFGDAVNVAARLVSFAKARQILTTEKVVKSLKTQATTMTRHIDAASVKGKQEALNIYEVVWDGQGLTVAVQNCQIIKERESLLTLSYKDEKTQVSRIKTNITLGRGNDNDLIVNDAFTSRTHALVYYKNGKFIISDKSTNGTYLIVEGKSIYIHMDDHPLHTNGTLSLGRLLEADSPDVIHFELQQL